MQQYQSAALACDPPTTHPRDAHDHQRPPDWYRCPAGIYAACPACKRLVGTYLHDGVALTYWPHPDIAGNADGCPTSWQTVADDAYRVTRANALLTSVHPEETTSDQTCGSAKTGRTPVPTAVETTWRHSGWTRRRNNVLTALHAARVKPGRIEAFTRCGADAWVYRSPDNPETYKVGSCTCHDRFCQPCASDRAYLIKHNLARILQERNQQPGATRRVAYRFVTLTIQTRPGDALTDSLNNLYAWFKRLRTSKLWRSCVRGGAAICELKWIDTTQRWHPHLHVITEGRYIPQDDLRREWRRITVTSHIVDVRAVRDNAACIHYVTAYASKPLAAAIGDSVDLLTEAIDALAGRKLVHCFGSWHRYALLAEPDGPDWIRVGRLQDYVARAKRGDAVAQRILIALARRRDNAPIAPDDNPRNPMPP